LALARGIIGKRFINLLNKLKKLSFVPNTILGRKIIEFLKLLITASSP
jgi:hypothetical protein